MNATSAEIEFENPWKKRELFPKISVKHTILGAIVCLICAAGLPLCGYAWFIAPALTLLLCGYVAYVARSPFSILIILLTAFATAVLGFGLASVAAVLALIAGTMTLAYLVTVIKHFYVALPIPFVGYLIAALINGDWELSLFALTFVPAGLLLALATVRASGRTSAVCCAAGGFLLSLLAMGALWVWKETGGLGREQILAVVNAVRDALVQALAPVREEFLAIAAEAPSAAAKQMAEYVAAAYGEETVMQMLQIVPAVAVVLCSILAFDAQLLLGMTYFNTGLSALMPRHARIFTMSLTSAVLYSAAFLLMVFIPADSLAAAVIQNLTLILMPGFAILGIRGIIVSFARAQGGMRIFLIFFVVAALCCASNLIFYILGMWGAYGRISEAMQRRLMEKMRQDGDDRSDGDE